MKIITSNLPKEMFDSKPRIYFLIDRGEVVYVGQSENVANRIYQHSIEEKKVFDSVDIIECEIKNLNDYEAEAIVIHSPKYNFRMPINNRYISISGIKKKYPDIYDFVRNHSKPEWESGELAQSNGVRVGRAYLESRIKELDKSMRDEFDNLESKRFLKEK